VGWAWALILAEISPEQSDAILARGAAYGASRNVCNVHWRSDVNAGLIRALPPWRDCTRNRRSAPIWTRRRPS
jgi:acid phosphatase (class A)